MRIVVTGGAGFIGSHLVDLLDKQNDDVLVIDSMVKGGSLRTEGRPHVQVCQSDIRDPLASQALVAFKPDSVVHLAAQMSVTHSVKAPAEDADINVAGTLKMLSAAHQAGASSFVFASSGGAIYGDPSRLPATEETPAAPMSPYGVSKFCAETYLDYFQRTSSMRCVSLRFANVFGPRQSGGGEGGVVSIFASKMLRNEAPVIFGDGLQSRDFVFVKDVADAIVCAMNANCSGSFNVATRDETTLLQLTESLRRITGCQKKPLFVAARSGEVRQSSLSWQKASEGLNWRPSTNFFAGLEQTVDYFRHDSESSEAFPAQRAA